MPLLNLNVNQAKSQFFDRDSVYEKLDKQSLRGLSRWGAFVRRGVKSKLRKARQKKIAELDKNERRLFRIRQSIAKRDGLKRPRKPLAPSRPGEYPRMKSGEIKKLLFFSYDAKNRSVVVGPAVLNSPTGAPKTLEEGGVARNQSGRFRIERRPFMKPQFDELYPRLPGFLAGMRK